MIAPTATGMSSTLRMPRSFSAVATPAMASSPISDLPAMTTLSTPRPRVAEAVTYLCSRFRVLRPERRPRPYDSMREVQKQG